MLTINFFDFISVSQAFMTAVRSNDWAMRIPFAGVTAVNLILWENVRKSRRIYIILKT